MGSESDLSEATARKVKAIGQAVTQDEVDTYGRLCRIEDERYRLRALVGAWERQQTEERGIRRHYAQYLLWALFGQIVLVDAAFFLLGFGLIRVEQWVAATFIIAAFTELAGMTLIVVKYLFPGIGGDILKHISRG